MRVFVRSPRGWTSRQHEPYASAGSARVRGPPAPPLARFLKRHAHPREVELFLGWARTMGPDSWKTGASGDDLIVLVPAFAISQLSEAFAIGFLLFLPFLVIDMVVSNILLAMGMHMLSPVVVSLPFKLLLFVMIDGWTLLAQGLLQPYLPH